jgi:hypothetical protein
MAESMAVHWGTSTVDQLAGKRAALTARRWVARRAVRWVGHSVAMKVRMSAVWKADSMAG